MLVSYTQNKFFLFFLLFFSFVIAIKWKMYSHMKNRLWLNVQKVIAAKPIITPVLWINVRWAENMEYFEWIRRTNSLCKIF